jgi:NSS family neurotransmitter:Na+ symporter
MGFVLAAAGSAVGLGNIWKFPYITGENGGGAFVLIYLACIAIFGLPVMMAEILLGRATQKSPVGAVKALGGGFWVIFGFLGVLGGFVILSYYSVVAGWAMHFTYLALSGQIVGLGPEGAEQLFGELFTSNGLNLFWHVLFMAITIGVVWGGVNKGIERWSRILMPALFGLMMILLVNAFTMDGFGQAFDFVFGFHTENLTAAGVLEALGHAFFTLSLGMGAMLTYGSYLGKHDDIVSSAITISVLDTVIALTACMVLFPIIFSYGMEPASGPGLVFVSIPIALSQMPAGTFFAFVFFALLVFAALTSAISLLEVVTSYLIDEKGWLRHKATIWAGVIIVLIGIPSALSGGTSLFGDGFASFVDGFAGLFGRSWDKNWFDTFDYLASNWILPLGGLGISLFTAWRVDDAIRHREFLDGSRLAVFYKGWLFLLKFVVPVGIVMVFLHAIGVI